MMSIRIRARSGRAEAGAAPVLSRRAMLGGTGASLLAAGGLVHASDAEAAQVHPNDGVAAATVRPHTVPSPSTIASAPVSGRTYRFATMYEFRPFNPASQMTWGGYGVYTAGTVSTLRTFFDLPPNAVVHDIEWYVSNSSAKIVFASMWQYAAGQGSISSLGADATIPAGTSGIVAVRQAVPASTAGPFPHGSKLAVGMSTPVDGSVQVNGVRIGYTEGQGTVGLLSAPVRAYDSRRTGGILKKGSTRLVALPSTIVAPGTVAVLANITAVSPAGPGYLKVYPANASVSPSTALDFKDTAVANALVVGVSHRGKIKIYASQDVHVLVDITGTVG